MMTGLQHQRPWSFSAATRSAPQQQHGSSAESPHAEFLSESPILSPAAPPKRLRPAKGLRGKGR